jgi:hypothetical protein
VSCHGAAYFSISFVTQRFTSKKPFRKPFLYRLFPVRSGDSTDA